MINVFDVFLNDHSKKHLVEEDKVSHELSTKERRIDFA